MFIPRLPLAFIYMFPITNSFLLATSGKLLLATSGKLLLASSDERTSSPVSLASVAYGATHVTKPWMARETLDR